MFLKNKFFILLFLFVVHLSYAFAGESDYYLALKYLDDAGKEETTYIQIDEKPYLTFSSSSLEITAKGISLAYDKVIDITFVDKTITEIPESVSTDEDRAKIIFLDEATLLLTGFKNLDTIAVFSLDGKKLPVNYEKTDNNLTIHLNNLPKAVYVVKTKYKSFKVIKQ